MKIRIEIEYDPDWILLDEMSMKNMAALLEEERQDWLNHRVSVSDVIETGGTLTLWFVP